MLIRIYPENPNSKEIEKVANCLKNGGLVIFPTDTIYAIGCSILKPKAIEKMAQIKGLKAEKADFSFICYDLSHISNYTNLNNNSTFKLMKKLLPGAFTFILNATNQIPKLFKRKKKTIGIRVPDNNIAREIVKALGNPIACTSIHDDDEILEYTTDPELIYERYANKVDIVINGGIGENVASTVIDCTGSEPEIIRQGKGEVH